MKNLLFFLILIVSLSSCSRSPMVITETEVPEDVFYLDDQVKPFTGICVIYYPNTSIVKEKMTYVKGILNGSMTSYFADGSVKRKGSFLNGKMNGKWESWYKNGMRRYIATYSDDCLSGEYLEWFETGVMKEKGIYAQNIRSGEWVKYDEAGMETRRVFTE